MNYTNNTHSNISKKKSTITYKKKRGSQEASSIHDKIKISQMQQTSLHHRQTHDSKTKRIL